MMPYKSIKYATCNEQELHEVELVYSRGFWRWLFRMPERVETYTSQTGFYGTWIEKTTNRFANARKQIEIDNMIDRVKRLRFEGSE